MFIMLLSFFIILNAISTFDDAKSAPVLNSLTLAFTVPDQDLMEIGTVESARMSEAQGTTLEKIQGLFSAHITGVEAKQNRLGTELRLRLPFERFEREVSTSLKAPQKAAGSSNIAEGFFIPTLVSLLDTQNTILYKMDMVVNYTSENDVKQKQDMAEKIARISALVEKAGLPPKMITAGIGPGQDGTIDLYFRPFDPFDPEGFRKAIAGDEQGAGS